MSIYDEYMNMPEVRHQMETSNLWGGAARKKKSKGAPTTWNRFVSQYMKKEGKKKMTKSVMQAASKAYKSKTCKKTYKTNCKSQAKSVTRGASKWNKFQKEYGKEDGKGSLGDMSRKYRSETCTKYWNNCPSAKERKALLARKKRTGKGVFGGVCPECSGMGMFGGCDCCGGELEEVGEVMEGGASQKRLAKSKRCFTNSQLHSNLERLYNKLDDQDLSNRQRSRYVGAFRELLSQYNRGNLLGNQYLDSPQNILPGISSNMQAYDRPYPPLRYR